MVVSRGHPVRSCSTRLDIQLPLITHLYLLRIYVVTRFMDFCGNQVLLLELHGLHDPFVKNVAP